MWGGSIWRWHYWPLEHAVQWWWGVSNSGKKRKRWHAVGLTHQSSWVRGGYTWRGRERKHGRDASREKREEKKSRSHFLPGLSLSPMFSFPDHDRSHALQAIALPGYELESIPGSVILLATACLPACLPRKQNSSAASHHLDRTPGYHRLRPSAVQLPSVGRYREPAPFPTRAASVLPTSTTCENTQLPSPPFGRGPAVSCVLPSQPIP